MVTQLGGGWLIPGLKALLENAVLQFSLAKG